MELEDIKMVKVEAPGKAALVRQAMVRDYVTKLAVVLLEHLSTHGFCVVDNFLGCEAGSLLLEEVEAPNPYTQGSSRGMKYLMNLLDSVVTLACRGARQAGADNILTKISGREGCIRLADPVPSPATSAGLTATIFLNKGWAVDTDGGELRLSPTAATLATVPPVFDRVVFYPGHLVSPTLLPAVRDSLSCTVTYRV